MACPSGVLVPPADLFRQPGFLEIYGVLFGGFGPEGTLPIDGSVRISSWFRTIARNAACGGDPRSQHLIGWAIDLVPVNRVDVATLRRLGLTVSVESDHVHVQVVQSGAANALVERLRR